MDHRHALESQAAERYLLGELTDVEAEAFELHYFECADCSHAVESGEMFISSVRDHFRGHADEAAPLAVTHTAARPETKPRTSMLDALAAFMRPAFTMPAFTMPAMAALLAIVVYQNAIVIPAQDRVLNMVRPVTAVMLMSASRGERTAVPVRQDSPIVILQALLPPGQAFGAYVCVISRGSGEISRSAAPAPAEGEPISLEIPAAKLPSGNYELTVYGRAADGTLAGKISEYPFAAQDGAIQPK